MLQDLRARLVERQNDKAVELAERAINDMPTSADANHLAGIAFARVGNVPKAAECFERALLLTPDDTDLHMNVARLHLAKGDVEQAKAAFKNAAILNPNSALAHSEMGHLEASRGRLAQADEFYQTALRADPNSVPALVGRGHILLERKQIDEAYQLGLRAVKLAPKEARTHTLLGRVFLVNNNHEFARKALQNAIDLRADFFAARVLLAQVHLAESHYDLAGSQLNEAAKYTQKDLSLALTRAELYGRTQRFALAAEQLDIILKSVPHHLGALRARTSIDLRAGLAGQAITRLRQIAEALPQSAAINEEYLATLARLGLLREAIDAAKNWITRAPEMGAAHSHLASVSEATFDLDGAQSAAEQALKIDSQDVDATLIAARARLRVGKLNDALNLLSGLRTRSLPDEVRLPMLRLRARVLDALGERTEAVTQWQEAAKLERLTHRHGLLPDVARGPECATLVPDSKLDQKLVFLVGAPASGVEAFAMYLAHVPNAVVLNDRFSHATRTDLIAQVSAGRLESGFSASDLEHVRSRYIKALRRIIPSNNALNQPVNTVFDWLPVIDVRQYRVMRKAMPEAQWLVIKRDARDCVLSTLAGMSIGVPATQLELSSELLGNHSKHNDAIAAELAPSDMAVAFDPGLKPESLKKTLQHLGLAELEATHWQNALRVQGGLPGYFSNQRWQAYEKQLGSVFQRTQ